jgi:hypothetical protein
VRLAFSKPRQRSCAAQQSVAAHVCFGPRISALGRKQTSDRRPLMSALPPKADIVHGGGNVRLVPFLELCAAKNLFGECSFRPAVCRAGCKRRRTDVISTGIPRITRRFDAEARCPFRVKSGHGGADLRCPLYPRMASIGLRSCPHRGKRGGTCQVSRPNRSLVRLADKSTNVRIIW